MKPKFKRGDEVLDNCGCILKIKKVGRKYYTVRHTKLPLYSAEVTFTFKKGKPVIKGIKNRNFDYLEEIKGFDGRVVEIRKRKEAN